jgi:hypothetical protein
VTLFSAGQHQNKPGCQILNGGGEGWAINVYSGHGKAMLALILSAQAQGKTITVWGNGTCDTWYSVETAVSIQINN